MGFIGSDGKYYSGQAKMAEIVPQKTSVWKQSDHDRQRADHRADLIRPYNPDGTPNEEFVSLYPTESQETYNFIKSDEDIAKEH